MLIDKRTSEKIRYLSVFAMVSVLLIHANNIALVKNPKLWFVVFSDWFFTGIQMWAVPFFFMVSGFLFDKEFEVKKVSFLMIVKFWKKKIKSLLIPYLCWAIIGAVLTLPLFMSNNWIRQENLFYRTIFASENIWSFFNHLFGICCGAPYGNGPLWYVRLLLLLLLFAPLIVVVRKTSKLLVFITAILLILFFSPVNIASCSESFFNAFSIKIGGIGWFLLGMSINAFKLEKCVLSKTILYSCIITWIIIVGGYFYCDFWLFTILYRIAPLPLIIFLWFFIDVNNVNITNKKILIVSPFNFFIYCMHMPIIATVSALQRFLFGCTIYTALIISVTSFLIVLFICTKLGEKIKMLYPRFFCVLNGGR